MSQQHHAVRSCPGNHRGKSWAGPKGVDFSAVCRDTAGLLSREGCQDRASGDLVHGGSAEANPPGRSPGNPATVHHLSLRVYLPLHRPPNAGDLSDGGQRQGQLAAGRAAAPTGRKCLRLERHGWATDGQPRARITIQSVENGKRKMIRDDYTGKIETVNSGLLASCCWKLAIPR